MSINLAAVDAALIDALPVLSVTAFPVLAITAGVALWLLDQLAIEEAEEAAGYRAVGRATVRRPRPVETRTEAVNLAASDILPPAPAGTDAGSPLYAELRARQILRELGAGARTGAAA